MAMKLVNIRIEEEEYRKFKVFCFENGWTIADRFRQYVKWDIKGGEASEKPPAEKHLKKQEKMEDWLSQWN
jgi:hypothetical protein